LVKEETRDEREERRGERHGGIGNINYKSIMLPLKVVMLKDIKASRLFFWHRPS
jgi:hypothetical protein